MSLGLTAIQDHVSNKQDFIELGRSCANVCKTLDRGLHGKELEELNEPLLQAIGQLTT